MSEQLNNIPGRVTCRDYRAYDALKLLVPDWLNNDRVDDVFETARKLYETGLNVIITHGDASVNHVAILWVQSSKIY